RNYGIRKHVLQYDDVMNQQRTVIYGQRLQVLRGENMRSVVSDFAKALIEDAVKRYCAGEKASEWDVDGAAEYLERICLPSGLIAANREAIEAFSGQQDMQDFLLREFERFYSSREEQIAELGIDMRELERAILLRSVDARWMDHIDAMDQLRDGIGLRAYGQKDPVNEYKLESLDMFEEMVHLIQEDTLRRLCMSRIEKAQERKAVARVTSDNSAGAPAPAMRRAAPAKPNGTAQPIAYKPGEKIGRNSPCPCGSGKTYKNCHGRDTDA
ncbi:MAG: SEC-C domain-containing protein, partial [Clostridia bacterium]|nr:SEC-C domain-containing protein [Clostridia bacterium]